MDQMATGAQAPKLRFSTSTFAQHQRVAAWRESFGHGVLKLDIESLSAPGAFDASATLWRLPSLGIIAGTSSPVRFERKKHLADNDDVSISIAVAGTSRFFICGREYTLRLGDATLTSASEGGINESLGNCRYLVLRVPRSVLPSSRPIDDLMGRRIPAETPALRLLRHYTGVLEDSKISVTPDMLRSVATHIHDLMALALGATRDATELARSRGVRAARLRAIKVDIEANLASEDLSVAAISARHRLPVRYLQRLFEEDGATFTAFVLARRLERAHRLLTDPMRADRPISMIAFEVGFGHVPYFNEAFRRRYGASPSDVRAQARRVN